MIASLQHSELIMKTYYTPKQMTGFAHDYLDEHYDNLYDAAADLYTTSGHLSYVQNGKRAPTKVLLERMGFKKVTMYVKVNN